MGDLVLFVAWLLMEAIVYVVGPALHRLFPRRPLIALELHSHDADRSPAPRR